MYLLDTDHMTVIERGGAPGKTLQARLSAVPLDQIATSIVSYEEQMRGWLAQTAKVRPAEAQIAAYASLQEHLRLYCNVRILPYDAPAAAIFEQLRRTNRRLGTSDLKIAAIALANNTTLLSRNLSHFAQVATLRIEDWSV